MLFKSLKTDITPLKHSNIESPLEINTVIFSSKKELFFIFSIDTLFIHKDLKLFIYEVISEKFDNISPNNIWITASHTHFAPSLEKDRIALGTRNEEYYVFLKQKISNHLCNLNKIAFKNVTLKLNSGNTHNINVNRRRKVRVLKNYFTKFISMEMNLDAFVYDKLQILKIYEINTNNLLSAIWNFACHPTNLYDNKLISSAFPGKIRNFIRNEKNEEIPILFLQGFAGNLRAFPPKRKSWKKSIRSLLQLSYPVSYYRFQNKLEYEGWINNFASQFKKIYHSSEKQLSFNTIESTLIQKNLTDTLGVKAKNIDTIYFRKLKFGDVFSLVGISAEIVAEYTQLIQKNIHEPNCFFVGYVDEVYGYLPTLKQIEEGGYEAKGFFKNFLIEKDFSKKIESNIVDSFKELG